MREHTIKVPERLAIPYSDIGRISSKPGICQPKQSSSWLSYGFSMMVDMINSLLHAQNRQHNHVSDKEHFEWTSSIKNITTYYPTGNRQTGTNKHSGSNQNVASRSSFQ